LHNDGNAWIRPERYPEMILQFRPDDDHSTRASVHERITQGEFRDRFTFRPETL